MEGKYKLMIGGLVVAAIFVAVGVGLLSFAAETFDKIAELFGAPEWEVWHPPFPDYEVPGFEGNLVMNFLLGLGFTALILLVTFITGWTITRIRSRTHSQLTNH